MEALETIEYRGHIINICQDEDYESPRVWGNLGTMVCWHSGYDLGDEHDFTTPDDFRDWADTEDLIILPLWLYDHSGLRIKVGNFEGLLPQGHAYFDTMQVGWIYVSTEQARKEYNWKVITNKRKETIIKYLKGEVEVYDQYLSGQVYGYDIEGPFCNDSCWVFYGDWDDLTQDAEGSIDYSIEQYYKEHGQQLKAQIKHRVPLQHRKALTIF